MMYQTCTSSALFQARGVHCRKVPKDGVKMQNLNSRRKFQKWNMYLAYRYVLQMSLYGSFKYLPYSTFS